jgi:hypothetical protein
MLRFLGGRFLALLCDQLKPCPLPLPTAVGVAGWRGATAEADGRVVTKVPRDS